MFGRFWSQLCSGDLSQGLMLLSIPIYCLNRPYNTLWCYRWRLFWKDVLDFEYCSQERTSSIHMFAGWRNVEVFAICPQHHGRYPISAGASDWALCLTNHLLLLRIPPVLSYYSVLSLDEEYGHLVGVVDQSKFAVLALMYVFQTVNKSFLHTFKCHSHIKSRVYYLVAMTLPVISSKTVGICAIFDCSGYGMAAAFTAEEISRFSDWLAVTPEPVVQLFSFSMRSDTVFVSANGNGT